MKSVVLSLIPLAMAFGGTISAASEARGLWEDPSRTGVAAGITQKGTIAYREMGEAVFAEFHKVRANFVVLNRDEVSAAQLKEEFANYCLDNDYSDLVSWQTARDATFKVTFSCVLAEETPKIRERLFVFSFQNKYLVDVQVASADIVPAPGAFPRGASSKSMESRDFFSGSTGKVVVAVSGAMLSSGVSAATAKNGEFASSDVVKGAGAAALAAGVSAAMNHLFFDMAPSPSGMAGGALTIAFSDVNDSVIDPITRQPRGSSRRKGESQKGLGPVSVHFTFKF